MFVMCSDFQFSNTPTLHQKVEISSVTERPLPGVEPKPGLPRRSLAKTGPLGPDSLLAPALSRQQKLAQMGDNLIQIVQDHETVLDGIGIILCLLLICYLIYNRVKYGRMLCGPDPVQDFGDQMTRCMVTQHSRRALTAVMAKVIEELQWLEKGPENEALAGELPPLGIDPQRADSDQWGGNDPGARTSENLPHELVAAVSSLIETGMGILEISRSVQRPVAEIELCAWLAQNRNRLRKDAETGFRRQ